MRIILLYSHTNDPVTRSILNTVSSVYPISIKKFLNEAFVFDEIDNKKQSIKWKFPDGITITNDRQHYLINRVLGFSEDLFEDFDESDRSYARSELKAYLTFAIESFPLSSAKPGAFGMCGNHYSLPRQWEIIKKSGLEFKTPQYFLGNLSHCYQLPRLVCSHPFKYYFWKPSIASTDFAFIKPEGEPIVSRVIGDDVLILPYHSQVKLTHDVKQTLKDFSLKLQSIFSLNIFEALFFRDNSIFTFGMISTVPLYSSREPYFNKKISFYYSQLPV